ncbi:bacteriorhodopsin [Guptibacillus hwajinpoensis]|uniref:bacteriorhodopsin n=1 Tax=Guptibacillus hwajinpoensis TaxID=208199 RepID=UPI001CD26063|nr:bacteriorhodopsin [Pseudalkalibacillus hwajinpoensis]MCA0989755.1 bacteriorhodopsin [Pseudalkalibacillus hwajinpoensis]
MNSIETSLHIFYFIVMISSAIYFYLLSRKPKGVPLYEYVIAIVITGWSGVAYLSIALGQGLLERPEKTIYFARYLDWVVSTPLLLLPLALTAMFYQKKINRTLIASLIIADVFMILTGLIADFSPDTLKYIWYSLGLVALAIILRIIWGPLKRMANESDQLAKHYKRMAIYLTSFWVLYPLAWFFGASGVGLTKGMVDTLAFIVLPIFSKVGFGILDLHGLRKIKE